MGTIHLLKCHYTNCLTSTEYLVKQYKDSYHQTKIHSGNEEGCLAMEETAYS